MIKYTANNHVIRHNITASPCWLLPHRVVHFIISVSQALDRWLQWVGHKFTCLPSLQAKFVMGVEVAANGQVIAVGFEKIKIKRF